MTDDPLDYRCEQCGVRVWDERCRNCGDEREIPPSEKPVDDVPGIGGW